MNVVLAKSWVRTIFAGAVDEDALYDLVLCADELVDNGRKHGRKDGLISVAAYLTATTVLLEVTNDGLGATSPHVTVDEAAEEGRGLMIVAAVSARCGSYLNHDTAQVVWCEFPRSNTSP
jgi:two-component sensor histidine kinase